MQERGHEPRLSAHDEIFNTGYGPRVIRLSYDRKALFVGCKDGSVTKIDLAKASGREAGEARTLLCGARETGVRSLCDLGEDDGRLLLGQDDGSLSVLPWRGEVPGVPVPLTQAGKNLGACGYIGRWETKTKTFIVSPRHADAFFLRRKGANLVAAGSLPRVRAMSGYARLKGDGKEERWIVCKTGALWWLRSGEPEPQDDLWKRSGFERPGFVFDIAVVRSEPDSTSDEGIYLSTDEGVFLLRRPFPSDLRRAARPRFILEPVYLPGITGTCIAIAHSVQKEYCLLWVSDVEGTIHLFWSEDKFWETAGLETHSHWRRSGLLERRFPVMRAIASWEPKPPYKAIVGQACRDDRVVVSWYEAQDGGEPRGENAAELLSWGDVESLDRQQKDTWSIEALVADLIEEVGSKPEVLRRFLRNPHAKLAGSALAEILKEETPRERAGQALTLWTHTLIGTVHRRLKSPGTQDYLGIIRWLRRLGESEPFAGLVQRYPDLRQDLDRNIQYARKWGLFGNTYGHRESVLSALKPLLHQTSEERQFDRLVYESLLFRRRVDPVEILPTSRNQTFAPWELRHLELQEAAGRAEYVAVSWVDSGAVYRRRGGEGWQELDLKKAVAREMSGRILLGALGEEGNGLAFFLSCPPRVEKTARHEARAAQIQLRFLGNPREPAPPLGVQELLFEGHRADAEAVYCLHDLGKGRIAVGMEGISGEARFGLFEVTSGGELQPFRHAAATVLPPVYPKFRTLLQNPVWSLASYEGPGGEVVLLLGCGDGQIWKLDLCIDGDRSFRVNGEPILVGRLGTPVSALACRAGEGHPLRVFAGGADGTLVAFQALPDGKKHATLWATQEQGPVRSLHTHRSSLVVSQGEREGGNKENQHLVVAVTQLGRAVLFLDRPAAERRPQDDKPRRLDVPGERLGRIDLGSTAFGSALLPGADEDDYPTLARLFVAPATDGPRLLTLHHPKLTRPQRRKYRKLHHDWLASLHGTATRIQGYMLRRPETTYSAAPKLATVLVRWILPYGPEEESWEERSRKEGPGDELGPARQWLPRHLRPLVDLDTAWKSGRPLNGLLRDALLAAHEVGDKALFREIVEAALSRANHQLYHEAMKGEGLPFAEGFAALMTDLEQVKGIWEGSSGRLDSRMRIVIAKSLVDGDTLWSLSQVQGEARERAGVAMAFRIGLIHHSLGKGDLLLALETLRAANLALLRLCRRLEREPDENWDWSRAEPGRHYVPWEALSGFYQAVGDFAARVAHPKGNLGEVAAHEVCRAYALGMLICPTDIARLAFWVAEADLPGDVGERILQQVKLVEALLANETPLLSKSLRKIPRIAFWVRRAKSYEDALFFPPQERRWITEARIGSRNVKMIESRRPFDETVVWLHELAQQLTHDAGGVDLQRYKRLLAAIAGFAEDEDQFRHSRQFWKEALEDLDRRCKGCKDLFAEDTKDESDAGAPLRPVRPELVLFSTTLQGWCTEQRARLQGLREEYQIFEPPSALYDEALAAVERAAGRFPHGAAVQKSLVLGVLGHGLLELLDEHLLEVWEVAQALDPRRTWDQDELEGSDRYAATAPPAVATAASRFADYLLQRALKAEGIPKNLRSLQGLLSFGEGTGRPDLGLHKLLAEYRGWHLEPGIPDEKLDWRTYHFLQLTLNELYQNDQMHGNLAPAVQPRIWADWSPKQGLAALWFEFHYPADDEKAFERAQMLADPRHHLQILMPPREEPRLPSHGTGLYLANLAAGAVGWKLMPQRPETKGVLRFRLLRKSREGQ